MICQSHDKTTSKSVWIYSESWTDLMLVQIIDTISGVTPYLHLDHELILASVEVADKSSTEMRKQDVAMVYDE